MEREGLLIEMEQVYKGAFLNRRQPKGRDIYDITFLCSKTRPNYAYLEQKFNIKTPDELKERLQNRIQTLDLNQQAKDVSPFLFYNQDIQRVLLFNQFVEQTSF